MVTLIDHDDCHGMGARLSIWFAVLVGMVRAHARQVSSPDLLAIVGHAMVKLVDHIGWQDLSTHWQVCFAMLVGNV